MPEGDAETTVPTTCGHCGNVAPMQVVAQHFESDTPDRDSGRYYDLLLCPACRRILLRAYSWHDGLEPEDVVSRILYPAPRRVPRGLPATIATAFEAATKVRSVDPNAYAVLIGRVLELVCGDRGAQGKSLSDRLRDLARKGEIPDKLVHVADSLRELRNVGAHPSLGELTAQELPILDDLCMAILEYVYAAPHLVQQAEARLAALKRPGDGG